MTGRLVSILTSSKVFVAITSSLKCFIPSMEQRRPAVIKNRSPSMVSSGTSLCPWILDVYILTKPTYETTPKKLPNKLLLQLKKFVRSFSKLWKTNVLPELNLLFLNLKMHIFPPKLTAFVRNIAQPKPGFVGFFLQRHSILKLGPYNSKLSVTK